MPLEMSINVEPKIRVNTEFCVKSLRSLQNDV